MRDRRALEVELDHLLARIFAGLFDGHRNFVGLAVPDADVSAAIAGDDQRAKAERSPALDDLGAAIDSHDGGFHAGLIAIAVATAAASAALSAPAATVPTTATTAAAST